MKRKNKVMLALALGAVALVIASGAVRCSLATPEPSKENTQGQGQVESSGEAAREEPSAASFEEAGAQGGFADLKNTTWVSEDGKSALSIIEGALIESGEAGQSILYYSVESEQAQHDGLTATLAVSDSMTDDEELTVAVVQMSSEGRRTLTCDKLSCAYVLEEVQATAITRSRRRMSGSTPRSGRARTTSRMCSSNTPARRHRARRALPGARRSG